MSKDMMPRFAIFRVLVLALGVLCSFSVVAGDLPQSTRNVVYDKIEGGYRFNRSGQFIGKIVVQL